MSVAFVDPSEQAMSSRVSAVLRTKQAGYLQANASCDSSGKSYLRWAMMLLLVTNVVLFIVLVTSKSTPNLLQGIGYPWSIVVVAWSSFYIFSSLFGSKQVDKPQDS
jgi:glycopeptide antibiotics resistance protein